VRDKPLGQCRAVAQFGVAVPEAPEGPLMVNGPSGEFATVGVGHHDRRPARTAASATGTAVDHGQHPRQPRDPVTGNHDPRSIDPVEFAGPASTMSTSVELARTP
jgi:hypothetical protein